MRPLLSPKQAMEVLGIKSRRTLAGLGIPTVKVGARLRYRQEDLESFACPPTAVNQFIPVLALDAIARERAESRTRMLKEVPSRPQAHAGQDRDGGREARGCASPPWTRVGSVKPTPTQTNSNLRGV